MNKHNAIPIEYVRQCFSLDDATGALFWKIRPLHHFPSPITHRDFNNRYAGLRADADVYRIAGYRRVRITINGKKIAISAHRIVLALLNGKWPELCVDHIDGIRTNNVPSNLRELSHADNMRASAARRFGYEFVASGATA